MDVVDDEQHRLDSAQGTMRGLEDPDRLEHRRIVRAEQERLHRRPVPRLLAQRS
jgi:hypothetical protein